MEWFWRNAPICIRRVRDPSLYQQSSLCIYSQAQMLLTWSVSVCQISQWRKDEKMRRTGTGIGLRAIGARYKRHTQTMHIRPAAALVPITKPCMYCIKTGIDSERPQEQEEIVKSVFWSFILSLPNTISRIARVSALVRQAYLPTTYALW